MDLQRSCLEHGLSTSKADTRLWSRRPVPFKLESCARADNHRERFYLMNLSRSMLQTELSQDVNIRREAAKQQIKQQVETAARQREEDKEKRRQKPSVVSALRKKNKRLGDAASSHASYGSSAGYASHG